ncbi:MAG: adenylate kinase, partial [Deltaproteobacteria bacterium]
RVRAVVAADTWAVDGNYRVVRDLYWARAEIIIWLDYQIRVNFWRLLKRTLRRAITQEEIWNGNREPFLPHLKLWSDESLFHWLFKTYWMRKREYPTLFALLEYQHLRLLRFRSPKETEKWVEACETPSVLETLGV